MLGRIYIRISLSLPYGWRIRVRERMKEKERTNARKKGEEEKKRRLLERRKKARERKTNASCERASFLSPDRVCLCSSVSRTAGNRTLSSRKRGISVRLEEEDVFRAAPAPLPSAAENPSLSLSVHGTYNEEQQMTRDFEEERSVF